MRTLLSAVAAVSPCQPALHSPGDRLYEWHFLRPVMARFRRKASLYPHICKTNGVGRVRFLPSSTILLRLPRCGRLLLPCRKCPRDRSRCCGSCPRIAANTGTDAPFHRTPT
jgi:hypothetical protein